ncbi:MAG: calcium/sodium antiporter [Clostridiales bacterium]|nr:calcium/sodium antiporter [Clostridiales bacterium]
MTVWTIILLVLGMALLIKGADFFVDGASSIAKILKIPTIIIGLTLVSIGTTLPEAAVSITTALQGSDGMTIGNVVGSNIFNTMLILGLSVTLVPVVIDKEMRKSYLPILCFVYALLIVFSFLITPYKLDRWEGIILLVLFLSYILFLILKAKKSTDNAIEQNQEKKSPLWISILLIILGGAGIIVGSDLVVDNATIIAKALGMSDELVGLTILSVGTSLPELVTSIVAAVKKEKDISIGNVVGASIYNVIFILGVSSTITPLGVISQSLVDMLVMLGTGLLIFLFTLCGKKLNRWQGIVMITIYLAYLAFIIARNYAF